MIDPNQTADSVFLSRSGKTSWLQTASGGRVSVTSPRKSEIKSEDIATALSKQCRYNGHCEGFYSVAEHCVRGADIALNLFGKRLAMLFLLHDASEAYIGDVIKPVKIMLPEFRKIEDLMEIAIYKRYNLWPISAEEKSQIKFVDRIMLTWEKRDLFPNSEEWTDMLSLTDCNYNFSKIVPQDWQTVYVVLQTMLTQIEPVDKVTTV